MSRRNGTLVGCSDFERTLQHPDRRSFVKAGLLGTMGLSLSDLLRSEAKANSPKTKPNSVIILWKSRKPDTALPLIAVSLWTSAQAASRLTSDASA